MFKNIENIKKSQFKKKIVKVINFDLKLLLNNKRFLHNNVLIYNKFDQFSNFLLIFVILISTTIFEIF